ncbi:hypothetical protein [Tuwongella immobilis]|uniref:Uncharacterized protein n=1 Tax=Tuwongella immobilis TaxID=692036 RepID=A0A6C2YPB9_9BACT|nr:hypothetical protein [Tuwongella immobilis]VIP02732.1 unnamed protein product [Tuwongella immobilis]VTS02286.1 unnamed protein product [Tuwongella immobilis]
MRIEAKYGTDCGEWLVEVYLETEADLTATPSQLESAIRRLLRQQKIKPSDVADFFCYRQDAPGKCIPIESRLFRSCE